jgi:hypothetical protein
MDVARNDARLSLSAADRVIALGLAEETETPYLTEERMRELAPRVRSQCR